MTAKESKETEEKIKALLNKISQETRFILQECEYSKYLKSGPSELEIEGNTDDVELHISEETVADIEKSAKLIEEYFRQLETLIDKVTGIHPPRYKDSLDDVMILTLYNQGISVRKIAKQMGCSPSTISRRLSK